MAARWRAGESVCDFVFAFLDILNSMTREQRDSSAETRRGQASPYRPTDLMGPFEHRPPGDSVDSDCFNDADRQLGRNRASQLEAVIGEELCELFGANQALLDELILPALKRV